MTDTDSSGGHTMFEYALHRLHHDDLVRQGEEHRLAREATRLRRTAAPRNTEAESHTRRHWFTRAA
ncbi:hypothetical protein [Streptomyces sp. NPDC059781]|uniref:hypothetical protein n=1 Tax=unclassified Streptomyces TaxID=2593676 RepID=UPI00364DAC40